MEKKDACILMDTILVQLKGFKIHDKNYVYSGSVLGLIQEGIKIFIEPNIRQLIEYLKGLETNCIKDNIDVYIVQTIMYDILSRIEDSNKLTIKDFKDIHDSLMNINQNFFHKEEGKVPIIFVFNPSTLSLISGFDRTDSKVKTTIIDNNVEKMNIISKLRKKDSPLVSNISKYNLQPSMTRIIIDSNWGCNNLNEIYEKIMDIYRDEQLSMDDLLDKIEIRELTVKQIASIYAKLFAEIDNDVVVHIKKDDIINLAFKE